MKYKRYVEAETSLESILSNSEYSKIKLVYLKLGEVYLNLERVDKLFRLTNFITKNFPNEAYGFAGLAAAWALKAKRSSKLTWKLRQANDALDNSEIAIKLDKNCALGHFVKGIINFHMPSFMGRMNVCSRSFESVLRAKDNQKSKFLHETYYYLAKAYRKLRKNNKAIRALRNGLKRYPNSRGLKKLLLKYEK